MPIVAGGVLLTAIATVAAKKGLAEKVDDAVIKPKGDTGKQMLKLSDTTTLELEIRDIVANDDLEAIVNAANDQLSLGGGVAGAIRVADKSGRVQQDCNTKKPCPTGQAVLTTAGDLQTGKMKGIIHAVGPRYSADRHNECCRLLRDAYQSALKVAENNGIRSLAFPFLSAAIFGFSAEKGSSKIAFEAVRDYVEQHPDAFDTIRFVCLNESNSVRTFAEEMTRHELTT